MRGFGKIEKARWKLVRSGSCSRSAEFALTGEDALIWLQKCQLCSEMHGTKSRFSRSEFVFSATPPLTIRSYRRQSSAQRARSARRPSTSRARCRKDQVSSSMQRCPMASLRAPRPATKTVRIRRPRLHRRPRTARRHRRRSTVRQTLHRRERQENRLPRCRRRLLPRQPRPVTISSS